MSEKQTRAEPGRDHARASEESSEARQELPIRLIERVMNPTGLGEIPEPDGYAHVRADCGDSMEIFLRVRERRIEEARFYTPGCGPMIACGSMATEIARGRTVGEALRIGPKQISEALDGLPASEFHCAELAAEALKKALEDCLARARDPWKKPYPRR